MSEKTTIMDANTEKSDEVELKRQYNSLLEQLSKKNQEIAKLEAEVK